MNRYLVAGAAEFIVSHVCEFLLEDGHSVVALDNMNLAYDLCIKEYCLDRLQAYNSF